MAADEFYAAAERRIEYFTAGIGVTSALFTGIFWNARIGAGVAAGAFLSWINFRWIRLGVQTLARYSKARQKNEKVHVPASIHVKTMGRYALLAMGAYVILKFFRLPVLSLLAGFSSMFVGVLVEAVRQLLWCRDIPRADS